MELKSAIGIRADDPAMRPLHRHLAALPVKPGRPDRARVLLALLEIGAAIVFEPERAQTGEVIRACKALYASLDDSDSRADGRPIRVVLLLPDTQAMQPLRRRLTDLPEGPGTQARSRLVMQVLHAGVNAVYRDLPPPVVGHNDAARYADGAHATEPAPPVPSVLPQGMTAFLDNLSVEGLG
ncbi:hypothetical protein GALL_375670 [mine drainage metagenome]|uniref:Uncharacterized protein n=1 Tax=mine drainage metagenome TaxID=410659 RepID=A0A1J5QAJ5_9ZZZZ